MSYSHNQLICTSSLPLPSPRASASLPLDQLISLLIESSPPPPLHSQQCGYSELSKCKYNRTIRSTILSIAADIKYLLHHTRVPMGQEFCLILPLFFSYSPHQVGGYGYTELLSISGICHHVHPFHVLCFSWNCWVVKSPLPCRTPLSCQFTGCLFYLPGSQCDAPVTHPT